MQMNVLKRSYRLPTLPTPPSLLSYRLYSSNKMTATQSLPTTKYPNLAKPLEFGAIKSRNRNFMASLTRNRAGSAEDADNTVPGQDNFDYYTQRARGGVGVLLTGESRGFAGFVESGS